MLRGAMPRAEEMAGTAVFRIVVSSDSIKNATATSHGKRRLETSEGSDEDGRAIIGSSCVICSKLPEGLSAKKLFVQSCPWSFRNRVSIQLRHETPFGGHLRLVADDQKATTISV